ncbi:MAG: 2-oxoglutarate dehydrogenase complex dihydrolipoyllysine-residue succinyltransferase [Desulfobacterales bacterium]|nr:2-oxoglutarate dehydrogenase complex dihydrolipoyllysine-residue succinyltransferase [Desulfobacterales bacterium]
MTIEIKVPSVGESVTEALLAEWYPSDGAQVQKGELIFVIETDKVTLEVEAEAAGRLEILVAAGETVAIGTVVGRIDTDAAEAAAPAPEQPPVAAPAPEPAPEAPAPEPAPTPAPPPAAADKPPPPPAAPAELPPLSPSVRRLAAERQIDLAQVPGSGPGGRITKGDVILFLEGRPAAAAPPAAAAAAPPPAASDGERRVPMSPIRKRIAQHLLAAKQNTAMLTTFNEIDMGRAMDVRKTYKDAFQKRHGISLGFMSFFVRACVEALKEVPEINAFIEGNDIVYHDHCHIGIAVGGKKGLVVPVLRHAEQMGFAAIEQGIVDYVTKIRENRLELADLEGGTFTISNGGVFGSLLSTPILNMPQSGILGMHKIEKRAVVVDDQIVVRPMMYVALSYDHRIVDGKGAVTFLRRVKEFMETPERILLEV